MAFFPVPSQPSEADVADALSLALVSGLMGRRKAGVAGLSMDQAFTSASRYRDEVLRSTRGWVAENQSKGGTEAEAGVRLQSAITLASALVAGQVSRHVDPAQALLEVSRLRDPIWSAVRGLETPGATPAAATLMAGALQGEVAHGQDPLKALTALRGHSRDFGAAARNLLGDIQSRTDPAADVQQPLTVASSLYATALAGLVGRGERLSDALVATRSQREVLVKKSLTLSAPSPPPVSVELPPARQWRQGRETGEPGAVEPNNPKGPTA